MTIHKEIPVEPEYIPEGSRFIDYKDFVVQGIKIKPNNIRYRLKVYQIPNGDYIVGKLPQELFANLFVALIGYSGSGKTHASAKILDVISRIEAEQEGQDAVPGGKEEQFFAKACTQCLRLALNLHVMGLYLDDYGFGYMPEVSQNTMQGAIDLIAYFKESQIQIHKTFLAEKQKWVSALTPAARRLVDTILKHRFLIENDMIPTQTLMQRYNQKLADKSHLSAIAIGRMAHGLGLKTGFHVPG